MNLGTVEEREESKAISKFWARQNCWVIVLLTEMRLEKEWIWGRKLRVLFLLGEKR